MVGVPALRISVRILNFYFGWNTYIYIDLGEIRLTLCLPTDSLPLFLLKLSLSHSSFSLSICKFLFLSILFSFAVFPANVFFFSCLFLSSVSSVDGLLAFAQLNNLCDFKIFDNWVWIIYGSQGLATQSSFASNVPITTLSLRPFRF